MGDFLIPLFIVAVVMGGIVVVAFRVLKVSWGVLTDAEEARRVWQENKRRLLVFAAVIGVLVIAGAVMVTSFVSQKVQVGRVAFDYLKNRYGMQTNFVMSITSEDKVQSTNILKPGQYQLSYTVGTNSGVLTLEKGASGDYYSVLFDEPK